MIDSTKPTNLVANRRNGFTLVEILVVMVILATMGGMVVAAVQGVTQTGAKRERSP